MRLLPVLIHICSYVLVVAFQPARAMRALQPTKLQRQQVYAVLFGVVCCYLDVSDLESCVYFYATGDL
jgi:hypothetical protein